MRIPPLKYFFMPKRWRWFLISIIKKWLHKHGELEVAPLTKAQMYNITNRVIGAQECFKQGYCKKCKCNMVDSINTQSYTCKHGCFGLGMENDEELAEFEKEYDYKLSQSIKRK